MIENRKIGLCLIAVLAAVMTAMTFLYRQPSPFWIISQLLLLSGVILFLGMAVFFCDVRKLKQFALPVALLAIGELMGIFSNFYFLMAQNKIRMAAVSAGQPIELLAAVAGVIEFAVLAWTVIDISTDFSFCNTTALILVIGCGFSAAVNAVLLFFGIGQGAELFRMQSVFCFSDLFSFATAAIFYLGYTKERRMMYRLYRICPEEQKSSGYAACKTEHICEEIK